MATFETSDPLDGWVLVGHELAAGADDARSVDLPGDPVH